MVWIGSWFTYFLYNLRVVNLLCIFLFLLLYWSLHSIFVISVVSTYYVCISWTKKDFALILVWNPLYPIYFLCENFTLDCFTIIYCIVVSILIWPSNLCTCSIGIPLSIASEANFLIFPYNILMFYLNILLHLLLI